MTKKTETEREEGAKDDSDHMGLAAAIFYSMLIVCLTISIVVSFHSFLEGTKVTHSDLKRDISEHTRPGIVFFGVGFKMDVCSRIKLDPSADSFGEILEEGRHCMSKQIDLFLNDTIIDQWSLDVFPEVSDFITYVNNVVLKYRRSRRKELENEADSGYNNTLVSRGVGEGGIRLNVIIIEGPSRWIAKNALYCRIISPKLKFLHPFYILNDFTGSLDQLEEVHRFSMRNSPVEAIEQFHNLVHEEKHSFRSVPTKAMTSFSMSEIKVLDEHKLSLRVVNAETIHSPSTSERRELECVDVVSEYTATTAHDYVTHKPSVNWTHHVFNYSTIIHTLCNPLNESLTFSETIFQWRDGFMSERDSFDSFNPWTLFSTLTAVILSVDRIYTTVKRYKAEYQMRKKKQKAKQSPVKSVKESSLPNNSLADLNTSEKVKFEPPNQTQDTKLSDPPVQL